MTINKTKSSITFTSSDKSGIVGTLQIIGNQVYLYKKNAKKPKVIKMKTAMKQLIYANNKES